MVYPAPMPSARDGGEKVDLNQTDDGAMIVCWLFDKQVIEQVRWPVARA